MLKSNQLFRILNLNYYWCDRSEIRPQFKLSKSKVIMSPRNNPIFTMQWQHEKNSFLRRKKSPNCLLLWRFWYRCIARLARHWKYAIFKESVASDACRIVPEYVFSLDYWSNYVGPVRRLEVVDTEWTRIASTRSKREWKFWIFWTLSVKIIVPKIVEMLCSE